MQVPVFADKPVCVFVSGAGSEQLSDRGGLGAPVSSGAEPDHAVLVPVLPRQRGRGGHRRHPPLLRLW